MSRSIQVQHEFYDRLMESQYGPPAERDAAQRRQLERLARHARETTRFYRDRLNAVLHSDGSFDWERWGEVPVLKRSDLLEHGEDMLTSALPNGHGPIRSIATSGSTGAPVTVTDTSRARSVMGAVIMRSHHWHGLDWSKPLLFWLGDDPNKDIYPNASVGPPWGPQWEASSTGPTMALNRFNREEDVVRFLRDNHVPYLSARPRSAQSLALAALRSGISVKLDKIVAFSTAVLDDEIDDCRSAFGAEIASSYASKEGHNMAFQCPTGRHFHVNEETTLLEIVDDNGLACEPGQIGRVVITNLHNFAQPIIRYDHGDLAVWGKSCACGRTLKVIDRIVGRSSHLFRFPDGFKIAPFVPSSSIRALLRARFWQIAQVGPYDIEVRYVPDADEPADEQAAEHVVRQRLHPNAKITFRRRTDLDRADGGKFLQYVYEVPA
jgi:phenylacetate-CoA ligase